MSVIILRKGKIRSVNTKTGEVTIYVYDETSPYEQNYQLTPGTGLLEKLMPGKEIEYVEKDGKFEGLND
jgi:hypothetical protein